MNPRTLLWCLLLLVSTFQAQGQQANPFGNRPLKWYTSPDSSRWLAFHTYLQLWGRVNQNNPGTKIFDNPQEVTGDISIRRFRVALQGQLTKRLFAYTQLGINNLNYLSPRGTSIDLLDAYAEYKVARGLEIGGGKTAWAGLSRYSAPNTSKLLTYDLNLLPLPAIDQTNDLIRNLSLYAKGKVGRLDYRLVASKPFSVKNSGSFDPIPEENIAKFTNQASSEVFSGYFKWEFGEQEQNKIPFSDGTYLGQKRVINLGAGFGWQSSALWHLQEGDTVLNNMVLWAVDFFLDQPVNPAKKTAFNFYAGYFNYNFGPNYVANIGVNNPANDTDAASGSFNGPGNSFPIIGTGNSILAQAGFLLSPIGQTGKLGQIQPYFSLQYSDFERLADPMIMYDLGVNWYFHQHLSKLSFNIQNRPIYFENPEGITQEDRKLMFVLQYLIRLE